MSKTRWAVSSGSYSDYRVRCVCSSKKVAEAVAARMNAGGDYEDCGVEEIAFLAAPPEKVIVYCASVNIWDNGVADEVHTHQYEMWDFECGAGPVSFRWVRALYKGGRLDVQGTNWARVMKVLTDRRAMLLTDPVMRARDKFTG